MLLASGKKKTIRNNWNWEPFTNHNRTLRRDGNGAKRSNECDLCTVFEQSKINKKKKDCVPLIKMIINEFIIRKSASVHHKHNHSLTKICFFYIKLTKSRSSNVFPSWNSLKIRFYLLYKQLNWEIVSATRVLLIQYIELK